MTWSNIAEVEELTQAEFTHHADSTGISTFFFFLIGLGCTHFVFNLGLNTDMDIRSNESVVIKALCKCYIGL